ncbi:endolytic transglycosylase MltG [bacterium]|nr:MAG: endolytic transglycosylase MltG [bacterium]
MGLWSLRFLILLGGVLVIILAAAYFFYGLQPSYTRNNPVTFQVMKGESFRAIGARLSQESLIRSIAVFKTYSILTGNARKFQPGIYQLASTMSIPQIVDFLVAGGKNEITVKIIEGETVKDIDAALATAGVITPGAILNFPFKNLAAQYSFLNQNSLEGFLFPDTYNFELNSSPETVLRQFLDTFDVKIWRPLLSNRVSQKDWYNSLILASYLEREVPDMNDRKIVAGIILKRLSLGWSLQIDATVSYAKCNGGFESCAEPVITGEDKNIVSPYNTYLNKGWTPTPIANPGKDALEAALSPKTSGYLFYLSDSKTGKTIFSKTNAEHNTNRAKYL